MSKKFNQAFFVISGSSNKFKSELSVQCRPGTQKDRQREDEPQLGEQERAEGQLAPDKVLSNGNIYRVSPTWVEPWDMPKKKVFNYLNQLFFISLKLR